MKNKYIQITVSILGIFLCYVILLGTSLILHPKWSEIIRIKSELTEEEAAAWVPSHYKYETYNPGYVYSRTLIVKHVYIRQGFSYKETVDTIWYLTKKEELKEE